MTPRRTAKHPGKGSNLLRGLFGGGLFGGALALAALALEGPAVAATDSAVRRYALVAGTNDGGSERVRLRYAGTDAEAMARVLSDLGGVAASDRIVLINEPGKRELLDALAELARRIGADASNARRTEAIVYYSGHSDENGLLLKGELLTYVELRAALDALPADVRVAMLDSCASGALVRAKGGRHVPAFLVDDSSHVKGHAFITSSSADEASQEADRIGGSYFTHALVSGMRGAADTNTDGRVTLNEAYRFAYDETLARTEGTQAGAQHPAYDIQLVGSGDLVMTDLRSTHATLELGSDIEGRVSVRDRDGRLAAELQKSAGRPVELGLTPGDYHVSIDNNGELSRSLTSLRGGGRSSLHDKDFHAVARQATVSRGSDLPPPALVPPEQSIAQTAEPMGPREQRAPEAASPPAAAAVGDLERKPLAFDLIPGVDDPAEEAVSTGLLASRAARLDGVAVAPGATFLKQGGRGAQFSLGLNQSGGQLTGAQFSLGANVADQLDGVQSTIGSNVVHGDIIGAQAAVGFNFVAGSARGVQASGGVNLVHGNLRGFQLGGTFNGVTGEHQGVQLNVINYARRSRGVQVGLVNVSSELRGLQVGLVNVNRTSEGGVPVGLLSIVKGGIFHGDVWADDLALMNVGVKTGAPHFYNWYSVGTEPVSAGPETAPNVVVPGMGFGSRLVEGRVWVDLDAGVRARFVDGRTEPFLYPTARLVTGIAFLPRFAPYVGVAAHFAVPTSAGSAPLAGGDWGLPTLMQPTALADGDMSALVWPGLVVGLRI